MVSIDKVQLTYLIKKSFSGLRYPGDNALVPDLDNHLEQQQVKDYFKGKKWEDITLGSLRTEYIGDESACLYFMTEQAARYYLPAYLLISVIDYNDADVIIDSVISMLTPEEHDGSNLERFYSWVKGFSLEQCNVISLFLLYMAKNHSDYFFEGEPNIALECYWRKFLDKQGQSEPPPV